MPKGTRSLPGMGDAVIEEIRDKALAYVDVRDQRMALTKREVEAKETLLVCMHDHKKKRYHDAEAELLVEIEAKAEEKITVRLGKPDKDDEEELDEPIASRTVKPKKKGKPNAGVPRASV